MDGLIKWVSFFLFCFINCICWQNVHAQQHVVIHGKVKDSSNQVLANAVVTIRNKVDGKIIAWSLSKGDGTFLNRITVDSASLKGVVRVEHSGYFLQDKSIKIALGAIIPDTLIFIMIPAVKQMQEVLIRAPPLPFSTRGDTIEFNAKRYLTPGSKKLQDLLGNMQGFEVSADGKISFNGKEVEKILIEGEDLAEKNYKLISRNLNAGWVDKVQVLNNYNDDRIIKEVSQSDKIGINLIIDEGVKNKLSGTVTVGAGTMSRQVLDNNLILLTKKIKWLSFLNYNNTGDQSDADLNYYYYQDLPENARSVSGSNTGFILNAGKIYPPELDNAYTRNNKELSGAAIASWKAGKSIRMKTMLAYGNSQLQNNGGMIQKTYLPDGQEWAMRQIIHTTLKNSGMAGVFSLSHDSHKNNTGFLSIEAGGNNQKDNYRNSVSGVLEEDAVENLNNQNILFRLNGFETWRIKAGKVFSLNYSMRSAGNEQIFNADTYRYQEFFMLDSSFKQFSQLLKRKTNQAAVAGALFLRRKNRDLSIKWRSELQHNDWTAAGKAYINWNGSGINLSAEDAEVFYHSHSLTAVYFATLDKKNALTSSATLGYQQYSIFTETDKERQPLPLFNGVVSFRHKFKPSQFINFEYRVNSGKPAPELFIPDSLLSGNASILNPAEKVQAPFYQSFSMQLFSNNLIKSSSLMITGSLTKSRNEYNHVANFYPAYTYYYYLPFNGNQQFNLMVYGEKYVSAIRLKFILQPSILGMNTNLVINEEQTENVLLNSRIQGKIVSGFKGIFNTEVAGTVLFTRNKTKQTDDGWMTQSFKQSQASAKIKLRPGTKIYFAALYQYYRYSSAALFNAVDIFGNYTSNTHWSFSLTLHNLFNSGAFVQRQVSANSYGEQRFNVMGRYMVLKVSWEF